MIADGTVSLSFEAVQKLHDGWCRQIGQLQAGRPLATAHGGKLEKQPERITVGRKGVGADLALVDHPIGTVNV